MPKFGDITVWQQAEVLMQPAFIRLIDNLRKQLEFSTWKGSYEDVLVWPEGITDEVKSQVLELRSRLETATPEQADDIRQHLTDLPNPYPGYLLRLDQGNQQVTVELWDLCYQICFRNYNSATGTSWTGGFGQSTSQSVEIDQSLFDETGEVDWHRLDEKTQRIVERVFANLPT
jgi:hypothetical protein